jgi:putative phosphoesterase
MTEEPSAMFDISIKKLQAKKLAVIGDIHSNLPAFQAVLEDLQFREYDAIVCLGDLVGYYTKPIEVIRIVRDIVDITVMGNHDWAAVDLKNPLFKISRPQAQEALKFTHELLDDDMKKWLLSLPLKVILETPYATITLVHGHPKTIFDYIYGSNEQLFNESIEKALKVTTTDYLFVGHSHIQGEYTSENGKRYVNPGAVGQPRDNDPRAAYCIVNLESKEVEMIRVPYDIDETYQDVIECCLPEELGQRLKFGI